MAQKTSYGALIPVAVTAVLFAAVISLWVISGPGSEPPAPAAGPIELPAETVTADFSVAFLPVLLAADAPVSASIAEDLTGRVTHALSELEGLRVAPVGAAAVYAQGVERPSVREISKALDVRYIYQAIIEGDLSEVRIRAQLADGVSGRVLWSGSFRAQPDTVLDLYRKITEAVWDEFDMDFSGLL